MVQLKKIAKNNLRVLITFIGVNSIVVTIAFIQGIEYSIIPLLTFIGGELFGCLVFDNIQEK